MDELEREWSLPTIADRSGRRNALRSLSAAGMALLAALGLAGGGEAIKNKNRHNPNRGQAERKRGGGRGKPGPTGPTGPTGPAGNGESVIGPTGPIRPTGEIGPVGISGWEILSEL